jgi:hypothetical protein
MGTSVSKDLCILYIINWYAVRIIYILFKTRRLTEYIIIIIIVTKGNYYCFQTFLSRHEA